MTLVMMYFVSSFVIMTLTLRWVSESIASKLQLKGDEKSTVDSLSQVRKVIQLAEENKGVRWQLR